MCPRQRCDSPQALIRGRPRNVSNVTCPVDGGGRAPKPNASRRTRRIPHNRRISAAAICLASAASTHQRPEPYDAQLSGDGRCSHATASHSGGGWKEIAEAMRPRPWGGARAPTSGSLGNPNRARVKSHGPRNRIKLEIDVGRGVLVGGMRRRGRLYDVLPHRLQDLRDLLAAAATLRVCFHRPCNGTCACCSERLHREETGDETDAGPTTQ